MMQASNPGTIWAMDPPWRGSVAQKFRRVFWAFGPSIEGWKSCRPVVSVDGTHLYGKYEGHALIATSIDGNGGLYPIAFAICEKENGKNWVWFLQSLKDFVTCERKVCIISDRFSGNKEVVRGVYSPNDGHAHRWCLRHIKANLKKAGITDKVVLDRFYSMGCANEVVDFNRLKEQLKIECENDWQWVEDHINDDREYWALAFDDGRRYGVMTTNWSESLNSVLRGIRSLPITAFVAATFYRVNQAFVERTDEGRKMTTELCPKVLDKIRTR
jgi:transposase-like protein